MSTQLTPEEHRQRHVELHKKLDELVADWIRETGSLPSNSSVMALMTWSYEQTLTPTTSR